MVMLDSAWRAGAGAGAMAARAGDRSDARGERRPRLGPWGNRYRRGAWPANRARQVREHPAPVMAVGRPAVSAVRPAPAATPGPRSLTASFRADSPHATGHNKSVTTTSGQIPTTRNCRRVEVSAGGINFSSCKNTRYMSLNYHRSPSTTTHPKSIWIIPPPEECHYFCLAEMLHWYDDDDNCWSVSKDAAEKFGSRGERLGFYQKPVNSQDPWHGFPVGSKRGLQFRRNLPIKLLQEWLEIGWINNVTFDRLIGGRL